MQFFRLQLGCLVMLVYVAIVYLQGISKYHVKITASHFWKILVLGMFTVVVDGGTAWALGVRGTVSPLWSYVFHGLSFIGLDSTIFFLVIYLIDIMERYPKKRAYLLYIPLFVNIILVVLNLGIGDYLSGKATYYANGRAMIICFVMIGLYLSATFIVCGKRLNLIRTEKRNGIITFLVAYAIVSTFQMFFSQQLSSLSVGITILVLGMYLNSEDPALKELSQYYSETVMSFANLIEERDGSTGGHIKRTSRYVALIVNELKKQDKYKKILSRDYIDNLTQAAPMHDVGKIAIPDRILQKPGKLDDEEYAIMKTHAEIGGKIITETFEKFLQKDYCDMAYEVARYHHEKWNGHGYPEGLKGEEIPLAARIMAVADVFDAISEKRCYRDAMPMDKCFSIIEEGRGTDFDPVIVDIFLGLRADVEKTHSELDT